MPQVSDIQAVTISLQVDGLQTLEISLDEQGHISRLGTGAIDNQEHRPLSGSASPELFRQVMKQLDDSMLDHMGSYDLPEKEGFHSVLSISLRFAQGTTDGFAFHYGSESQGPPEELARFVAAAVEITDLWYQKQKRGEAGK